MAIIGSILQLVGGIGGLICFIMVLIQMFQRGQTGLAIACIVLLFCCGIGGLIAFIYGWVKHREWGLTNVMIAWSGCIVLGIVGGLLNPINPQQFQQLPGR